MPLWKCFDGSEHPVSDGFAARVPADSNGLSHSAVKIELDTLLARSNADPLAGMPALTPSDSDRIDALTHVLNLNRALMWLKGRDYTEHFETLDQVHGQSRGLDCGCTLQEMFDHNRRTEPGNPVHPHFPVRSCPAHAGLMHDFKLHHRTATTDAQKQAR